MSDRAADPSDASTLHTRLVQVLALDPLAVFNEDTARAAIVGFCEDAVCARLPRVGGRIATFRHYFEVVFGRTLEGKAVKVRAHR